jgi:hypothetical protein
MHGTPAGLLVLVCGSLACGGTTLEPDGGAPADANPSDAASVDGGMPGAVLQLAVGQNLTVAGVTGDGWVVFTDDDAQTLDVVPLMGGATRVVAQLTGVDKHVEVQHDVAVAESVKMLGNGSGATLTIWSASGGTRVLATSSIGATVSPDSSRIVYFDHYDQQTNADIYGAGTDGTGVTFLTHAAQAGSGCGLVLATSSYFVVSYCIESDAGQVDQGPLVSYDARTWAPTELAHGGGYFAIDASGTRVILASNGLSWVPVSGGPGTEVDPAGESFIPTPDGSSVIYATLANYPATPTLRRSTLASPAPQTLTTLGGSPGPWVLSPDGNWLLYTEDPGFGPQGVYLSSATTPAPRTTLWAMTTSGGTPLAFTQDSAYALYVPDVSSAGAGTLFAASVHGGTPTQLARDVFAAQLAPSGPNKVVFAANYVQLTQQTAKADLLVATPGLNATPTSIATSVNPTFYPTPAGDRVVYTTAAQSGPLAGLYVAPVP